jgi:SH3-like domain-containing protein
MKRIACAAALGLGLAVVGCNKDKDAKDTPTIEATPAPDTAASAANTLAPSEARPSQAGEQAFVTGVTAVRRANSDDKQVDDPKKPGKKLSNYITTLHRGEQVQVLSVEGDWAQVRSSDEKEGWTKKDALLPSQGVTMATTLDETKTFDRPDLLALNAKRKVAAGALVYAMRAKDQFSEVNLGGSSTAWVLTSALVSEQREVDAAKLLNKARWLTDHKDASAADLMDLAKKEYGDTKVMQAHLAAQAAPPETPAPAPPPAPAPAPSPEQTPTAPQQ